MQQIDQKGGINLKGAAIGNGCWGNAIGTCAFANDAEYISVQFFNGHAMFPQACLTLARVHSPSPYAQAYYTKVMQECGNFTDLSNQCNKLLNKLGDYVGSFYIYNIVCRAMVFVLGHRVGSMTRAAPTR